MRNRYRMTEAQIALAARYGVAGSFPPDHTIPPPELFLDKPAYVVRQKDSARLVDVMGWGFPHKVPGKQIDKATGKPVLLDKRVTNVRNYTSPFWRSALANPERRCLVPFTSFSEYGLGPTGKRPLGVVSLMRTLSTRCASVFDGDVQLTSACHSASAAPRRSQYSRPTPPSPIYQQVHLV